MMVSLVATALLLASALLQGADGLRAVSTGLSLLQLAKINTANASDGIVLWRLESVVCKVGHSG